MKASFDYSFYTVNRIFSQGNPDSNSETFSSITTSSMEAGRGSLFVPLVGERDGHDFIRDALSRGAAGFLCRRNHPVLKTLNENEIKKAILVKDTLAALGELANFHRKRFNPVVIGITGSSGKTTIKDILAAIFTAVGKKHLIATEMNYNNEIGVPFTLFKINSATKIVICEMGMNHKGELSRISRMALPDYAIITGVGPAHIEYFKNTANIARAKAEIMDGMSPNGIVYIPDDILHKEIFTAGARRARLKLKPYSPALSGIKIIKKEPKGFDLEYAGTGFRWNMPGERLLYNIAGAVKLASALGIPPGEMIVGIGKFKPGKLRLNIVKIYYNIINDCYNANPDSMKSSLNVLSQFAGKKKKYAILGDMKELGSKSRFFHEQVAGYVYNEKLDGLITYGKDAEFILKKYISLAGKNAPEIARHFPQEPASIKLIIEGLLQTAPAGAVVLIKGSRSLKMENITDSIRDVIVEYSNSK